MDERGTSRNGAAADGRPRPGRWKVPEGIPARWSRTSRCSPPTLAAVPAGPGALKAANNFGTRAAAAWSSWVPQIVKGAQSKGRWGNLFPGSINDWYVDDNNVRAAHDPGRQCDHVRLAADGTRAFGSILDLKFAYGCPTPRKSGCRRTGPALPADAERPGGDPVPRERRHRRDREVRGQPWRNNNRRGDHLPWHPASRPTARSPRVNRWRSSPKAERLRRWASSSRRLPGAARGAGRHAEVSTADIVTIGPDVVDFDVLVLGPNMQVFGTLVTYEPALSRRLLPAGPST